MKYLAAALVVLGLMACSLIGDLGLISRHDAAGWDTLGAFGLLGFALLCTFGRPS